MATACPSDAVLDRYTVGALTEAMKRPRDVQAGIGTKHYPSRIEQIQICAFCPQLLVSPQYPVNVRLLPSGDPTQDMLDPRLLTGEVRRLT